MTPLIKKAHKGNRDAMTELYQSNKHYVFYLCSLLLCDPKAADNACVHVFKNAWDYLLDGKIETEQEFTDFVVKKAVNHCKNKFTSTFSDNCNILSTAHTNRARPAVKLRRPHRRISHQKAP